MRSLSRYNQHEHGAPVRRSRHPQARDRRPFCPECDAPIGYSRVIRILRSGRSADLVRVRCFRCGRDQEREQPKGS